MLRNILAAVAGYIAMAAVLFALFSLLWLTVGPSRAFEPGSWDVPGSWVIVQLVLGLVGAYIGGLVCARVAHDARGATILIGLVIVFGVVNALIPPEIVAGPRPDERVDDGGDCGRPPADMVQLAQPAGRGRRCLVWIAEERGWGKAAGPRSEHDRRGGVSIDRKRQPVQHHLRARPDSRKGAPNWRKSCKLRVTTVN